MSRLIPVLVVALGCPGCQQRTHADDLQDASTPLGTADASFGMTGDSGSMTGRPLADAAAVSDAQVIDSPEVPFGFNASVTGQQLLADLDVLAHGGLTTTVRYSVGTDTDVQTAIERVRLYEDSGVEVMLALDVVRGVQASDDLEVLSEELFAAVDSVFDASAAGRYLVLGESLDVYARSLPSSQRGPFDQLVTEFLSYASQHPDRPQGTAIGIHTTLEAWVDPLDNQLQWLPDAEMLALSWYGLGNADRAASLTTAPAQFEEGLEAAGQHGLPLAIRELSYPSSVEAASNYAQQRELFESLLPVIQQRAGTVQFVAISALDDPNEAECAAFREAFDLLAGGAELRCSIGLRESSGTPREAYFTVLGAISALNRPQSGL